MGGITAYPTVGIATEPIKHSAIFYSSRVGDGDDDKDTSHFECPPLIGMSKLVNGYRTWTTF